MTNPTQHLNSPDMTNSKKTREQIKQIILRAITDYHLAEKAGFPEGVVTAVEAITDEAVSDVFKLVKLHKEEVEVI